MGTRCTWLWFWLLVLALGVMLGLPPLLDAAPGGDVADEDAASCTAGWLLALLGATALDRTTDPRRSR